MGVFTATRLIAGQLYGVKPSDSLTTASALAIILFGTMAGSYAPARRAAHVDPALALRNPE